MSRPRLYRTGHNQARSNFVKRRKRGTSTIGDAKVEMEAPRIAARRVRRSATGQKARFVRAIEFYCQSDAKQRTLAVRRDMRIINPRRWDLFALLKELKSYAASVTSRSILRPFCCAFQRFSYEWFILD